jgi:hypothetical protein
MPTIFLKPERVNTKTETKRARIPTSGIIGRDVTAFEPRGEESSGIVSE